MTTLGIKNNNPGNIRPSGDLWQGMTGTSAGFLTFVSMIYGVRAAIINFRTWYKRGQTTLRKFISTYAPDSENDTAAYIEYVSKNTGINPDTVFQFNYENVRKILYHMFVLESQYKMDVSTFDEAWTLATGQKKK